MKTLHRKNAKTTLCLRGFFIFIILFSASPYYAQQAPDIEWQHTPVTATGKCLIQTRDGGFAIAGVTNSRDTDVKGYHPGPDSAHPSSDIWISKLNSSGAIQWQKCLGGSGDDGVASIIQTSDGGFVIAGRTSSKDGDVSGNTAANLHYVPWIVKLDSLGNIRWTKCYDAGHPNATGTAEAWSVIQNSDGEYMVTGWESFTSEGCYPNTADVFLIKLDSSGKFLWQKCYGGSGIDNAYCVIQTFDGGYAICGYTTSTDGMVSGYHVDTTYEYRQDVWIVKVNSGGGMEWQKCLGGTNGDQALSIVQSSDSGFVIGGITGSNDGDVSGIHGGSDVWVVKLHSSGSIAWQKCFGGKFADVAYSMVKTSDSGFALAGVTGSDDGDVSGYHHGKDSTQGRVRDIWVLKLNSSGILQWQKCLGGSAEEFGYSIVETKDGGYAITGTTASNDGDAIGNLGNKLWVVKLKGTSNGVESGLFSSGSVPYQNLKVYPNPSSDLVHLQMRGEQLVTMVKFYDVMGRELTPPPTYDLEGNSATVQVRTLVPGIYVARLFFSYNDYRGTKLAPLIIQH
jgi:hypothetical protein